MRLKKFIPLIVVFVILIVGACGAFAYYITSRQTIEYCKVDGRKASKNEAKNSSPVIVNNILVGATYKNKWVDADSFFENSPKSPIKISTFIDAGKTGAYDVKEYRKNPDGHKEIFVDTTYKNFKSEYVAVAGEAEEIMQRKLEELDKDNYKEYEKYISKALRKLAVPNKTVKIRHVYDCELYEGTRGELVVATSKSQREKGIYSAICYVENGKSTLIKLSYIKDLTKSALWPMYDVKFMCDLNKDNKYEIVVEEVTEFDVKYSVLEKRNNDFVEVIGAISEVKSKKQK